MIKIQLLYTEAQRRPLPHAHSGPSQKTPLLHRRHGRRPLNIQHNTIPLHPTVSPPPRAHSHKHASRVGVFLGGEYGWPPLHPPSFLPIIVVWRLQRQTPRDPWRCWAAPRWPNRQQDILNATKPQSIFIWPSDGAGGFEALDTAGAAGRSCALVYVITKTS